MLALVLAGAFLLMFGGLTLARAAFAKWDLVDRVFRVLA